MPDGFEIYWNGLIREHRGFSKLRNGGGSVILLGAISIYGLSPFVKFNWNQNSQNFFETLQNGILQWLTETFGKTAAFNFQKDNAPIHRSASH